MSGEKIYRPCESEAHHEEFVEALDRGEAVEFVLDEAARRRLREYAEAVKRRAS